MIPKIFSTKAELHQMNNVIMTNGLSPQTFLTFIIKFGPLGKRRRGNSILVDPEVQKMPTI